MTALGSRGCGTRIAGWGVCVRVAVIRGGLGAWAKAGLPVEAVPRGEMEALPVFD
jgi:hypothetical protein